jgi:hypothetical protein
MLVEVDRYELRTTNRSPQVKDGLTRVKVRGREL